ncbi:acyltransferase [Roseomonas gilardii]|uniref:acyltransferase n=1 Tax=Roseomonas gilardii TaxID=257708 RepID=UPI001643E299|nr:acyltransferase [Roseomonas gilardii]
MVGNLKHNQIQGSFDSESKVTVNFRGENNVLWIGDNVNFRTGVINFRGSNQEVRLEGNNMLLGELHLSGNNSKIRIGKGTKSNSPIWMNLGEMDDTVDIGEGCLFANVRFRTSDSHPIYDNVTGSRINHSKPIKIGNQVWIAEDVLILKGACVGDGCVIGARSLVTGKIPDRCIATGIPAKVIRQNIRWSEKF